MTAASLIHTDRTPFFDPTCGTRQATRGGSAAAGAVMTILNALNSQSVRSTVQTEFTALKPTFDSSIASWADNNPTGKRPDPSTVGCIGQAVISKQNGPIGTSPTYGFVGLYAASCGLDCQSALNDAVG